MRTHRFVGATSREVLHKVKQALGDDAMILSNRAVNGAIEVVAVSSVEMSEEGAQPVRRSRVEMSDEAQPVRAPRRPAAAPAPRYADEDAFAEDDDGFTVALGRSEERPARLSIADRAAALERAEARPLDADQPEISAAFLDFVRRNERPRPAAAAFVAAPVRAPVAAPAAARVAFAAAQAPAPAPVAAAGVVAAAPAPSIPTFAATAVTRSTASPAIVVASVAPAVVAQPVPPAVVASWPAQSSVAPAAAAMPVLAPVAHAQAPAAAPAPAAAAASAPVDAAILDEIKTLRTMLQQRDFAAFGTDGTSGTSGRSAVMHELLNAGFSPYLSRRVADEVCSMDSDPTIDAVAECVERELWIAGTDEIVNNGGVYALVGPTGVGKTTTVAKLAARAVVRFGASKVALLTTDGYRVGAHDQLRIYGRILGVPVHAIRDGEDLANVLAGLTDRHLVLIDTIGMSQRDRSLAEQAAMLAGAGDVKRLLLVQTTANARTLDQVVTAYKKTGVDGCILTKTDEAASIAPALDVVIRHQLPVHYVTDGQRVPEDIQLPDPAALVREALQPEADAEAFDLMPEELPFMMPSAANQPRSSFMMPRVARSDAAGVALD